ncbi:Uncharacterised protein [Cronobacter sakazakii]|nr:Uncharacterised protein [Cronobacter sakazakii]
MALLAISILLLIMKRTVPWPLLWLTVLAGLADMVAMASIYCHASVVTWQHVNTWAMFLGSVVLIGASLLQLRLALRPAFNAQAELAASRRLSLLALAVVLIRLLIQPAYYHFLAQAIVPVTFPLQPLSAFNACAGLRPYRLVLLSRGRDAADDGADAPLWLALVANDRQRADTHRRTAAASGVFLH